MAQRLSGIRSGNVTHLQHVLMYSLYGLAHGQLWRIFTPNLTNGPALFDVLRPPGVGHLLTNVLGLLAAGPAVERRLGSLRYMAVFIVSGAVAYGWLVLPLPPSDFFDGTSGALYGVFGALAVLTFMDHPRTRRDRIYLALIGLFALVGFSSIVSNLTREIHGGGLMAGIALTLLFERCGRSIVAVGSAVVVIGALCGVVALRTPEIKQMDARLHPHPESALGRPHLEAMRR